MKDKGIRYYEVDLLLSCAALLVLIVITVAGVAMRYMMNRPLQWMEELQLWCIVWVVFLGASAVSRRSGHIAIDAFVGLFPRFLRNAAWGISRVVTTIVMIFFGYQSLLMVRQMITSDRSTNILSIPLALVYAAIPAACVIMALWGAFGRRPDPAGKAEEGEGGK